MKIRNGFVSNSSSSSFVFINKTSEEKTWYDFIKENEEKFKEAIDVVCENYEVENCSSKENIFKNAIEFSKKMKIGLYPGDNYIEIGEDCKTLDWILDCLCTKGDSENFGWRFVNASNSIGRKNTYSDLKEYCILFKKWKKKIPRDLDGNELDDRVEEDDNLLCDYFYYKNKCNRCCLKEENDSDSDSDSDNKITIKIKNIRERLQ